MLYLWSPFADQTFSGASVRENARRDHFFPGGRVHDLPRMIFQGLDPADPRVSPLFAEFPAPPPALIQASSGEILRDDAVRLAEKLRASGGEVLLDLQEDAPHVWHMFYGWFPEAKAAVLRTGEFIRSHLGVQGRNFRENSGPFSGSENGESQAAPRWSAARAPASDRR